MTKKRVISSGIMAFLLCLTCMTHFSRAQLKASDDQVRGFATEEMSSILKAVESRNYEQFSRDFSDQMKKAETAEKFSVLSEKFDKSLGKLVSLDYLGFYVKGANTVALFKARFSKSEDDLFMRLVVDLKSPKQRVTGLWFD